MVQAVNPLCCPLVLCFITSVRADATHCCPLCRWLVVQWEGSSWVLVPPSAAAAHQGTASAATHGSLRAALSTREFRRQQQEVYLARARSMACGVRRMWQHMLQGLLIP